MSENENGKSYIHIDFDGVNSVLFDVKLQSVNPMQMFAMAQWLDFEARQALLQQKIRQMQEQAQKQILIPTINPTKQ